MRHLVTFPEDGPIVLAYGCSECYWRHEPAAVDEVYSGAALWNAQVLFERHDCEKFKVGTVEPQQRPKKRNVQAADLPEYKERQRKLRELWRDNRPENNRKSG